MYNLKKVIASICVIAMMLTTVAFGATYSDVAEDSAYYEAVETLNKLEIVTGYEDGTYKPEEGVTRAEMAALIARIQGYGDTAATSAVTGFADVPASHWASGYVANAASMGIINGYGDGNFGPEDPVLYEQAVKMVMATLGYTTYAEYNGGYPGGYIAAAQRFSVSAGVSNATMGTKANRGTIAQLLTNAIDTPIMAQEKWSTSGDVEYSIYDGEDGRALKTLLSENLDCIKLRGVVTANAYAALEGEVEINTEEAATIVVELDEEYEDAVETTEFLVGDTDANDFLGKAVVFYAKEVDNDEYAVVSIAADAARSNALEIDLTQFDAVDEENDKISYFKSATAKTATNVALNEDVIVLLNNDEADLDIFDAVAGQNGKITLVENDGKKGYDVIFVEVAATIIVEEVGEDYVEFKNSDPWEIDVDATDVVLVITKDGAKISYTDLAEWDVLSVIANDAASYVIAEVVSNSIVGTVTAKTKSSTSATGEAFKIAGTTYDICDEAYNADKIKVGAGGTFYINKYGKIAAFNKDEALASGVAANYGYVAELYTAIPEGKREYKFYAEIVTAEGVKTFEFYKNATIDEIKVVDGETVEDAADFGYNFIGALAGYELEGTIVSYTVRADGTLNTIKTVDYDEAEFEVASDAIATAKFVAEDTELTGKLLAADAKIFFIDEDDAANSVIGTVADLADKEIYEVIAMYTEFDENDADATIVLIDGSEARISETAGLAVVTSVGTTENEDAETVGAIGLLLDGAEAEYETTYDAYDAVDEELTVGDIVRVNVNAAGKLAVIEIAWNADEDIRDFDTLAGPSYVLEAEDGEDVKFVGGKVTNYNNNKFYFGDATAYRLSQAKNVYVVDASGRNVEIKKGSTSSFKVFENLYNGTETVDVKNDKEVIAEDVDAADAQQAADYVYIRVYDDKVVDAVVVKGVTSIR